ncbi:copper homeostasis membrane protein CopD [Pseudomonas huanghezhanensis]|uniref:copper homeostasis membrane protein CopD n=1 Tax=Pseudomonas huanghezhanensis TaxID=3002903 RepID=UPI0022869423|nr:copper homeostasis membrane protein CopD [Pseudomonas sp. BSw22131]
MHEGLILCRFVHFGAVLLLFGISAFGMLFRACLAGFNSSPLARHVGQLRKWLAALALLSALVWLALTAASMAGDWRDGWAPDTLALVLGYTFFGHVWIVHLSLNLLVLLAVYRLIPVSSTFYVVVVALLLFTLAPVGHGAMFDGVYGLLLITNQMFHLSGVGTWLGGLLMLAMLLATPQGIDLRRVLLRFSGIGYALVATIIVTGLINVRALSGALWPEPALSGFGLVLAIKASLVLAMLGLAAVNRTLAKSQAPDWRLLRASVLLEGVLGMAALAAVSLLGTLPPMLAG